jgi:hypothetical protein
MANTHAQLLRSLRAKRAAAPWSATTAKKLPPDPDGMNNERSEWAAQAIAQFQSATHADAEDLLCDLLCDLMHWADRSGDDFEAQLARASNHYEAETA